MAGYADCRSCLPGLKLAPVILDEVPLLSMTVTRAELVLIHLSQGLIQIPTIVSETIYRSHDSGAMTSAGTVHEELTS
jgi:hypothetical protein